METVMKGIIDMHIHAAPDVRSRKLDDLELMEASVERGVRAIVLKSHNVPMNDLLGSHFCSFMKGNGLGKPWCFYHSLFSILNISSRIFYKKAYTVDEPHLGFHIFSKVNWYREKLPKMAELKEKRRQLAARKKASKTFLIRNFG